VTSYFRPVATVLAILLSGVSFGADQAAAQRVPASNTEIRLSFAPIVRKAAPAVINIYATQAQQQQQSPFLDDPFFRRFFEGRPFGVPRNRMRSSLGSGVVVDESGVIATNDHVIRGATDVKVAFADGREYVADILIRDETTDLAVLKIRDADERFEALDFADSDDLEVGDLVLAIGNPFGVGQTVTSGIVSAVARTDIGVNDLSFFIQTDAAINPGNSGGPLVNLDGEVVGINTAIISRTGGNMGIGFAIPTNMAKQIIDQLIEKGSVTRAHLGVMIQELTGDLAKTFGLDDTHGVLIGDVSDDSAAATAGLKSGDIIVELDGELVQNIGPFRNRIAMLTPGTKVTMKIWRDKAWKNIDVTLGQRQEEVRVATSEKAGGSKLGMTVQPLTKPLQEKFGYVDEAGVIVSEIEPNSPAARAGIKTGSLVLEADHQPIKDVDDLRNAVNAAEDSVLLLVKDGQHARFVVVDLA
jgi:serine protease Do